MSKKTKLVMAGVAGLALCFAPGASAGIDARQHRQQDRIAQGVASGQLTPREAVRLERQEGQIRREERRFRADGGLSPRERAALNRDLNRTSRHIDNQRHDGQRR